MENSLGLLRINVLRGIDLAVRDSCSSDPYMVVKLGKQVYDKDLFTPDARIGDAEFDIKAFVEAVKMRFEDVPSGTVITKLKANRENCLAEEASIVWENGRGIQRKFLRLRNVERGEVELGRCSGIPRFIVGRETCLRMR